MKLVRDERIAMQRHFLLYAQRKFLSQKFEDEKFDLNDTNVPYDYDHILPQNFIKSRRGIKDKLRNIYNTNGNMRAWPFALNRSDQDTSLHHKFFPKDTEQNFEEYLKISLCDQDAYWNRKDPKNDVDASTLKKYQKKAIDAISNRNQRIYRDWYETLNIDNILKPIKTISPDDQLSEFRSLFDGRCYKLADNLFNIDFYRGAISIADQIYIQIVDSDASILEENNIEIDLSLDKFNPPDNPQGWHKWETHTLYRCFTLLSFSDIMKKKLAKEFFQEIYKINPAMAKLFNKALRKCYKIKDCMHKP
jgi:hypothetical protein